MAIELSKHIPEVSGGEVTVPGSSGELVVDTLLRDLQTCTVSLGQDVVATAADVSWTREPLTPGTTAKIRIKTWQNALTVAAATTDAVVSVLAIGN